MDLAKWQQEEMAKIYKKAVEKKLFTDSSHADKVKSGKMTVSDGIYLATVLAGAALNDGERVK